MEATVELVGGAAEMEFPGAMAVGPEATAAAAVPVTVTARSEVHWQEDLDWGDWVAVMGRVAWVALAMAAGNLARAAWPVARVGRVGPPCAARSRRSRSHSGN